MTPSQVRAELLGEHFELRRLIERARAVLRSSNEPEPELAPAVNQLADALRAHSHHEETALREILGAIESGARHPEAVMDARHVAEHAKLVAVLHAAVADDSDWFALQAHVGAVLDELEAHMVHEEEVLLGENLLG